MRARRAGRWAPLVGIVATLGCARAPAEAPGSPPPRATMLAPAARLVHGSLFETDVVGLPTGTTMTPDAAPGSTVFALDPHVPAAPELRASNAVRLALSADGRTLLLLTAGYNRWFDAEGERVESGSTQWVFVYDVAGGTPREVQTIAIPETFAGIAFRGPGNGATDGRGDFFVSGGPNDRVRAYARGPAGQYAEVGPSIPLGHLGRDAPGGLGLDEGPFAAGIGVTPSGTRLVVANNENDTVSLLDLAGRRVLAEIPLRPGGGVAGGEFPYGLVVVDEHRAFVTSQRDREVVEVDLDAAKVTRRITVGSSPVTVTKNRAGTRLYVPNANGDSVSVVDVGRGVVRSTISTSALPPDIPRGVMGTRALTGSSPNDAALSPDEKTLYVTNGGNNAVAFVALSPGDRGDPGPNRAPNGAPDEPPSHVTGFVPTGFYPHAVTPSADGRLLYVAFGKSPSGPNPDGPWSNPALPTRSKGHPGRKNEYALQLQHGGLHAFPLPDAATLAKLTAQTLINNRFLGAPPEAPIFATLRAHVKHVVYVVGENRSYDQILGDLPGADGDPTLVHWPARITPNQHALARTFVALDRFFDSGGVSGDGWQWSMMGRSTDVAEKVIPVAYAGRGNHSYDWEGMTRNVNVAGRTLEEREEANPATPHDPDLLPGTDTVGGVDEPDEGGRGLLWDAVLDAGRTVRNYGCFLDLARYDLKPTERGYLAMARLPAKAGERVAFPTRPSLMAVTDPYFWGFEMGIADYWREQEWERELDGYIQAGAMPSLELVRLPHDHLGAFSSALDGVDTPDTQMADHDYALGLMVEKLSKSPFWNDTIFLALEDDAQNGSDHVDAHRSVLYVAGGYARRGAVVSSVYATPSVLRTIELLLGLLPLGQSDAFAPGMDDVFQTTPDATPFRAIVPNVLRSTGLPLPEPAIAKAEAARGDATAWAKATKGYDFSRADAVPTEAFNRLLYCRLVVGAECAKEP